MLTLRRLLGMTGTVLLGGALGWAPVAAFTGDMLMVTKVGLAGVALLIIMKLLPARRRTDVTDVDVPPAHQSGAGEDER